jgi:hypothetical protein
MKLTHSQAYLLGSIAKHADHHRRATAAIERSLESLKAHGVLATIDIDAANRAHYASKVVDELTDQLFEEFSHLDGDTIRTFIKLAVEPTTRGTRRRFDVDEEF